jgi:hypothetical protein
MSRFNAPPPNGDSRKAIEQRAREINRPAAPEKKGSWPFPVEKKSFGDQHDANPAASSELAKKSDC